MSEETNELTAEVVNTETVETPVDVPETPETPAAAPVAPEQPKWVERRLSQMAAKRRELELQLEEARKENARILAARTTPADPSATPPATSTDPADFEARVNKVAAERAVEAKFLEDCKAVHASGTKAYPDFVAALQNFANVDEGGLATPQGRALIEAALATDDPAGVLYTLGKDVDKAGEFFDYAANPVKLGVQIAKLASSLKKPKAESKAPKPITPIDNRADAKEKNLDDEK